MALRIPQFVLCVVLVSGCATQEVDVGRDAPFRSSLHGISQKKGVGTWRHSPQLDAALGNVRVSWFYNWWSGLNGSIPPPGVAFVPMIWDETHVTDHELKEARVHGSVLLGFNEPDNSNGQADMTVEQALELWPQLEATGMRLGSPATAHDPSRPGSWLERFMNGTEAAGLRVDFICAHWYGSNFDTRAALAELKAFLQRLHAKFGLPIWLTEYSLISWKSTPEYPSWDQQAAFAKESTKMLEELAFVKRYAWFSLPPYEQKGGETNHLYESDGTPTKAGLAYRAAP